MIALLRRAVRGALAGAVGVAMPLPEELIAVHPALADVRWRRGGLPLRVGGWFLGQSTVDGITLGSTVFIAHRTYPSARLLLHEMGHVRQFRRDKTFPIRYLWESVRRGYSRNRYEAEADQFAEEVLWSGTPRHL